VPRDGSQLRIWCIDFKGHFPVGNTRCYPLTVLDAYSRYLIACVALRRPDGPSVRRAFQEIFAAFGLPAAIRSDNGPPFAAPGLAGMTELSVWWHKLGIRHERIAPGKPQQNGRLERFHLTLKQRTATPPEASLRRQQRTFDRFRKEYNEDRPHEALGQCLRRLIWGEKKIQKTVTYVFRTKRHPCLCLHTWFRPSPATHARVDTRPARTSTPRRGSPASRPTTTGQERASRAQRARPTTARTQHTPSS